MRKAAVFSCTALVLTSCSAVPPAPPGSGVPAVPVAAADSGALLPAVTDQEIDALIDVVMQGVDIPKP